jgi:hypothetical protein
MNPDISGTVDTTCSRNHLIGTGSSGGLTNGLSGNRGGVASPGPGAFSSSGGPAQTIPLLAGSSAIAHGDVTVCATATDRVTVFRTRPHPHRATDPLARSRILPPRIPRG